MCTCHRIEVIWIYLNVYILYGQTKTNTNLDISWNVYYELFPIKNSWYFTEELTIERNQNIDSNGNKMTNVEEFICEFAYYCFQLQNKFIHVYILNVFEV